MSNAVEWKQVAVKSVGAVVIGIVWFVQGLLHHDTTAMMLAISLGVLSPVVAYFWVRQSRRDG